MNGELKRAFPYLKNIQLFILECLPHSYQSLDFEQNKREIFTEDEYMTRIIIIS